MIIIMRDSIQYSEYNIRILTTQHLSVVTSVREFSLDPHSRVGRRRDAYSRLSLEFHPVNNLTMLDEGLSRFKVNLEVNDKR